LNIYFSISDTPLEKSHQRKLALYLLDYALYREYSIKKGEIVTGEHGKPYFKDSDVFFNYSHCKYGVACAVVKGKQVGVDIERITEVKPAVVKRVCCDNELKAIEAGENFIKIWVQKEAYSKFTGKGFAEGFKNIDTTDKTVFPPEFVFRRGNLYIAYYTSDP
jgi:4'-phosphopantetheinyl transferase